MTFSKFIDLLVKISYLYAKESQDLTNTLELPAEIFLALLEKLELSSGFLNLEKKTNKPHTSRTSLLPSHEILNLIENARDGNVEDVVNYVKDKNEKLIQRLEQLKLTDQNDQIPGYASHNVPQIMNINNMKMTKSEFSSPVQKQVNSHFENQFQSELKSNHSESFMTTSIDQFHNDLVNIFEMY